MVIHQRNIVTHRKPSLLLAEIIPVNFHSKDPAQDIEERSIVNNNATAADTPTADACQPILNKDSKFSLYENVNHMYLMKNQPCCLVLPK